MPVLIVQSGPNAGDRIELCDEPMTMGRSDSNTIPINDYKASRVHAQIEREEAGAYILRDLNSSNGTRINGTQVTEARLAFGDEVQIGKFTAVFVDVGGASPGELLDDHVPANPVNPVETTAIDTRDLQRMLRERQAAAGFQQTGDIKPPALRPSAPSSVPAQPGPSQAPPQRPAHRHFDTYTGPPTDHDLAPRRAPTAPRPVERNPKGQETTRILMVAVSVMGVLLLALTGVVIYLLLSRG